jgi:hypothetical protein
MAGGLRRLAAFAVVAPTALWVPGLASAHEGPPRVVLRAESQSQDGHLFTSSWSQGSRCNTFGFGDGFYDFPAPMSLFSGTHEVGIRPRKRQRPSSVHLSVWDAVDANGSPVGRSRELSPELIRHRHWNALFSLDVSGHEYISMTASWRDADCPSGSTWRNDAGWTFHLASD